MSVTCFDTKTNWDDCHFDQYPTHTIHLSGCTVICGQLKICNPTGFTATNGASAGRVWTSSASGVGTWQDATSPNIIKQICKVSHGFSAKDVLGWSGGTYNKAIANGAYDGEVLGIVSKCYNANCFDLIQSGYITGLTGLVTNTTYFLSDTTRGLLTATEPTTVGHISKSVLIATSASSGWVLPYPGYYIVTGGSTGGGITGATNGLTQYNSGKNVCLGGTLTAPVSIIATGTVNSLNLCSTNGSCCNLTKLYCGVFSTCSCDSSLTWNSCLSLSGFAQLTASNAGNTTCNVMVFRPDAVYLTIGGTSSGFQYAADYCNKFNANCRAIPDTGWVKSYVSGHSASISGTACHIPRFNSAGNNVENTTMTFISNVLCNSDNLTIEVPNFKCIYLAGVNSGSSYNSITLGKPTMSASITTNKILSDGAATNINLQISPKGNGYLMLLSPIVYIGSIGASAMQYTCTNCTLLLPQYAKVCGYGGDSTITNASPVCIVGGGGYGMGGCSGHGGTLYLCGGAANGAASRTGGTIIIQAGLGTAGGANGLICMCSQVCASSTMTATNFILSSDERLKRNVCSLSILPINVDYKQFELVTEPNQVRYGVIAQELQKEHPELIRTDENGMLTVAYIDLLVKEVAYLKCKITELENKIR